jgi:hypothetical protein
VGKALSHELEEFAVLGSALDALGCRSGAEAEKVRLMKSGEEDGRLYRVKSVVLSGRHHPRVCLNCGRIHEYRHGKAVIYVDSADLKLQKRVVLSEIIATSSW